MLPTRTQWVLSPTRNPRIKHLPLERLIAKWKIVRGDKVEVMRGKDKGKQGVVKRVIRNVNCVQVEGLNLHKWTVKSTQDRKGGVFVREAPMNVASVALLDPVSNKPTRVAIRYLEDGSKVRVAKRSGAVIPKPDILKRKRGKPRGHPLDTAPEAAHRQSYVLPFPDMQWIISHMSPKVAAHGIKTAKAST
eukprot:gnl/Hemi2/8288_TR2858_c0_g1_i1.p1 gnl/Hemi2/8288_TR2858_c0_g1~~gnl/Hemi2/8288_TR2858_c0_g1_i1.p1  ORF type:complete len:191 (-),score=20.45 gnl/Hemi2/8288_TR2858_c0_g1_i1:197-769(-)